MKYSTIKIDRRFGIREEYNYYTIIDKKRYLLKEWVSRCYPFKENIGVVVNYRGNMNYVTRDGTLLLPEWVDWCSNFSCGFGLVYNDELDANNYLRPDGTWLLSEWYEECWNFHKGFGVVKKDGKYNYVKSDGTFLLPNWVDQCWSFHDDGFGTIIKGSKKYRVDSEGNTYFVQNA